MKIKKLVVAFLFGMGMTVTSVFGYASITYILDKVVDQSVTVGDTVVYTEGLLVELESYDPFTLTYFDIEETNEQKHYITYTYSYTVLVEGTDIEVSSLSDDIVVSELTSTDTTISITFSLNQEKEFSNGDILNIQFYFEAIEQVAINMNDTTIAELLSIGFTESEATEIATLSFDVYSLDELYNYIYISNITERFEPMVNNGIIVFN